MCKPRRLSLFRHFAKARKDALRRTVVPLLILTGAVSCAWMTQAQETASPPRRKSPPGSTTGLTEKPASSQQSKPSVGSPPATESPKPKPPMAEILRGYLGRMRVKVDKPGKEIDTIVTHYAPTGKEDEIDVVIVHSPKKRMVGFYIYNFGNVSRALDQADLSGFLLNANDRLAIGSFFIDKEQDIGLKFSLRTEGGVGFEEFQTVYYGLVAAVKEYRGQVARKMEGQKEDAPKQENEKPAADAERTRSSVKPDPSVKADASKSDATNVPPLKQNTQKPDSGETRQRRVKKN